MRYPEAEGAQWDGARVRRPRRMAQRPPRLAEEAAPYAVAQPPETGQPEAGPPDAGPPKAGQTEDGPTKDEQREDGPAEAGP
ncbi:MAG: hypothetical protein FJ035_09480 [Chloroflexi bacterium]|nr:hypothetical protein [Chloroflexota bacterium]